jgi:site-specific DNA-methyltransferase (cytosine-N4-specific)
MIITGDARSLPITSRTVRLVVTSPPYLALRNYGTPGEIGRGDDPQKYVNEIMQVMDELERVLTPDGSVFMVIGDKYARRGGVDRKLRGEGEDPGGRRHARLPQKGLQGVRDGSLAGLPFRVALAAIDRSWVWRQEIIWRKPNPLPESVKTRCVRAHETILHLSRTATPFSAGPDVSTGHDVWDIPVAGYRDPDGTRHPAVFPERLVERIIAGWSAPGDLVLDPFAGSGTTPAVARKMGRSAIGVELNPEFAEVARRRILVD